MENSKRKAEEAELTKGIEEQRNRADIYGALFIVLANFHPVLTNIRDMKLLLFPFHRLRKLRLREALNLLEVSILLRNNRAGAGTQAAPSRAMTPCSSRLPILPTNVIIP